MISFQNFHFYLYIFFEIYLINFSIWSIWFGLILIWYQFHWINMKIKFIQWISWFRFRISILSVHIFWKWFTWLNSVFDRFDLVWFSFDINFIELIRKLNSTNIDLIWFKEIEYQNLNLITLIKIEFQNLNLITLIKNRISEFWFD